MRGLYDCSDRARIVNTKHSPLHSHFTIELSGGDPEECYRETVLTVRRWESARNSLAEDDFVRYTHGTH